MCRLNSPSPLGCWWAFANPCDSPTGEGLLERRGLSGFGEVETEGLITVELFEDFFKADGKKVVFIAYQPRLEEGAEGQLVRQPPPRAWPRPPLRPPA